MGREVGYLLTALKTKMLLKLWLKKLVTRNFMYITKSEATITGENQNFTCLTVVASVSRCTITSVTADQIITCGFVLTWRGRALVDVCGYYNKKMIAILSSFAILFFIQYCLDVK